MGKYRVFEILDQFLWFIEVIVPGDYAVTSATILRNGLRCEEIHHSLLTTPAQSKGDCIGAVQLISTTPLRCNRLLIRKHREIIGIGSLWPDDCVMENVILHLDGVIGDLRSIHIPQKTGVNPGEMPEISEVLDLAGGVAIPLIRPGVDDLPIIILKFRNTWKRVDRIRHRYPNQSVALLAVIAIYTGLGWDILICSLRNENACSSRIIPPAMIRAHDAIIHQMAQGECRTTVDTKVSHGMRLAILFSPDHDALAKELGRERTLSPDFLAVSNRVPAVG